MSPAEVGVILAAVIGSGGLGAVAVKLLSRPTDEAAAEEALARVRASDVENLRTIISELRTEKAAQTERLGNVERRLALLEDRERHMLTRAAVHEGWVQAAFNRLLTYEPAYPPPPPLIDPKEIRDSDQRRQGSP